MDLSSFNDGRDRIDLGPSLHSQYDAYSRVETPPRKMQYEGPRLWHLVRLSLACTVVGTPATYAMGNKTGIAFRAFVREYPGQCDKLVGYGPAVGRHRIRNIALPPRGQRF